MPLFSASFAHYNGSHYHCHSYFVELLTICSLTIALITILMLVELLSHCSLPLLSLPCPFLHLPLIIQDHLDSQKYISFIEKFRLINGKTAFGPAAKTEGWQPIDRGHIGAFMLEAYVHYH
jgi:hypothetical protein